MPLSQEAKSKPGWTFLFGYPLHGTYAPFLHNTIYELAGVPQRYTKVETQRFEDILEATKQPHFVGAAVTMPYKVQIVAQCDDLTPEGRAIGACNTIWVKKGGDGSSKLVGHNTDCVGIRDAFVHAGFPAQKGQTPRAGAIVGGGGASRSAVYALAVSFGCSPIYVVNRDAAEVETMKESIQSAASADYQPNLIHVKTVEQALSLAAPAYIVSCIPDFPPQTTEEKEARAVLSVILDKPEKGAFLEMCYHPSLDTAISRLAEAAGWHVITGEKAMIYQGVEQQKAWLGCQEEDLNVDKVVRIVGERVRSDKAASRAPPE